jgi:hypothetical protein
MACDKREADGKSERNNAIAGEGSAILQVFDTP